MRLLLRLHVRMVIRDPSPSQDQDVQGAPGGQKQGEIEVRFFQLLVTAAVPESIFNASVGVALLLLASPRSLRLGAPPLLILNSPLFALCPFFDDEHRQGAPAALGLSSLGCR